MRGAFVQVQQLARTRFPGIEVHGTPYPIPDWKRPLVMAAQAVQMALLAVCIGGDYIFRHLSIPPPEWYTRNVASNRFGAAMGVWFVGNMLITNLQNTGAFEVYFDGNLIFSKLAESRMPTVPELLGPMDAYFARAFNAGAGPGVVGGAAAGTEARAGNVGGVPLAGDEF